MIVDTSTRARDRPQRRPADLNVYQCMPMTCGLARSPEWDIENRLHWIRDVKFGGDADLINAVISGNTTTQ
jgi:hypothetical protein